MPARATSCRIQVPGRMSDRATALFLATGWASRCSILVELRLSGPGRGCLESSPESPALFIYSQDLYAQVLVITSGISAISMSRDSSIWFRNRVRSTPHSHFVKYVLRMVTATDLAAVLRRATNLSLPQLVNSCVQRFVQIRGCLFGDTPYNFLSASLYSLGILLRLIISGCPGTPAGGS